MPGIWDTPPTADEIAAAKAPASGGVWDAPPTAEEMAAAEPSLGEAIGLHGLQGATAGFSDELQGAMAAHPESLAAGPAGVSDAVTSYLVSRLTPKASRAAYDANYAAGKGKANTALADTSAAHPVASVLADVGGGALTLPASGLAGAVGMGTAMGLGHSEADLNKGEFGRAAFDTALSGLLGAGGYGAGKLIGAGAGWIGDKAAGAGQRLRDLVSSKAADEAAKVTNQAKGALGGATQDANRAIENLMRLAGDPQGMTAQQRAEMDYLDRSGVLSELKQKLAGSTLDKLPGAANKIEGALTDFQDLANSEGKRATDAAAQKLSGGEFWGQVGARAKRYGLPAVGGAIVGNASGGDLKSTLEGAGGGALAGAGLRPMMHSMLRLGKAPVVQNAVLSALAKLGGAAESVAAPVAGRAASEAESAIGPGVAEWLGNQAKAADRGGKADPARLSAALKSDPAFGGQFRDRLLAAEKSGPEDLAQECLAQEYLAIVHRDDPSFSARPSMGARLRELVSGSGLQLLPRASAGGGP